MNYNYTIERTVLASILNGEIQTDIDPNYFQTPFHKKLANGINRLKELDMPVDFELLRNKFVKGGKWTLQEDEALTDIMTHTMPFTVQELFDAYYDVLKKDYKLNMDKRLAI